MSPPDADFWRDFPPLQGGDHAPPPTCPACGEVSDVPDALGDGDPVTCTCCAAALVVFLVTHDDGDGAYVELREAQP